MTGEQHVIATPLLTCGSWEAFASWTLQVRLCIRHIYTHNARLNRLSKMRSSREDMLTLHHHRRGPQAPTSLSPTSMHLSAKPCPAATQTLLHDSGFSSGVGDSAWCGPHADDQQVGHLLQNALLP